MTETECRSLLFICPIMPQRGGNGLAMRAGLMLQALARRFDVHLLVMPVSGGSVETPDFVRNLTTRVKVIDPAKCIDPLAELISRIADPVERHRQRLAYPRPWAARFSGMFAAKQAIAFMAGADVDVIHVMRLYLAPLIVPIMRAMQPMAPVTLLDLDDDDVRVHERLADLHKLQGDIGQEEVSRAEAKSYAACEADVLGYFNAVLTASEDDARRLAGGYPAVRFEAVPNGYAIDPTRHGLIRDRASNGSDATRLLFVANLGYPPNADAASYLIGEVLPALRERGADIDLDVVGPGASADLLAHDTGPSLSNSIAIRGEVESVDPWYAQADIAVVPLRTGGGTRIKILEAFAHGVPVVSSSIGAEGLSAVHGRHVLCADNAHEFASACLRLVTDAGLAADLVANAKQLLRLNYTPDHVYAKLDAIMDSLRNDQCRS